VGRSVLLVSQPTIGGTAVHVRELAAAAVRAGWNVSVACPRDGRLSGWAVEAGARWIELPMTRHPGWSDVRARRRLGRLMRGFDVVHLHSSKAGALGRLGGLGPLGGLGRRRSSSERVVFTPHAWSWNVGGPLAPLYRWVERRLASAADVIVAVSDEEADVGRRILGRRADHVRAIPNGVDLDHFRPERRDRAATPVVLCVGRLSRQKGQDVLVRALAKMRTPARLRLVGEDDERALVDSLAKSLGVEARVDVVGPVADTGPEYRNADVVVVPSRWDGLSLVLLEAMASGAAIVATRVAGAAALEGAGVIVPPEDPAAMADAIDELLADTTRCHELGGQARAVAEARFGLPDSMQQTLDLWTSLLADIT